MWLYSAGGFQDHKIKVWDLESGTEARTFHGHLRAVRRLLISGDGKRLFSASEDTTIKVWDLAVGKEILTLRGHKREVHSLALSRDGKRLFSGGADGAIMVWDLEPK